MKQNYEWNARYNKAMRNRMGEAKPPLRPTTTVKTLTAALYNYVANQDSIEALEYLIEVAAELEVEHTIKTIITDYIKTK